MAHAHSVLCLFYCPERKPKPKPPKSPTPKDLHRKHREEDKRKK